jgi:uncharacterized protein YjbI with pentapeptide repeats
MGEDDFIEGFVLGDISHDEGKFNEKKRLNQGSSLISVGSESISNEVYDTMFSQRNSLRRAFSEKNLSKRKINSFLFKIYAKRKGYFLENDRYRYYDFTKTNLSERELIQKDFFGAKFINSILNKTKFENCDLYSANFSKASLYETVFLNSDLKNTVFEDSILINVSFSGSNISGIKFTGKNLVINSCDFSDALCSKETHQELSKLKSRFSFIGFDNIRII